MPVLENLLYQTIFFATFAQNEITVLVALYVFEK